MRHTFSSRFTLLHKLSLIALFLFMPCFLLVAPLAGWLRQPIPSWEWYGAGLLLVLVGIPGIWCASRLRRVQADDCALYISHHGIEVTIPLTQVRDVTDGRFFLFYLSPPTVTIHLQNPSPLGSEIVFIPPLRLYWLGLHPVAQDLKTLVERARGEHGDEDVPSAQTSCLR